MGGGLGVNVSAAQQVKENYRPTTPGFDSMEVLTSSDPFAAPLPGKKRGGLVPSAPSPTPDNGLRPGDILTPPPSHPHSSPSHTPHAASPHGQSPHGHSPFESSHSPANGRSDSRQDSPSNSLRDRRALRQLESRLATLEAHVGLLPGQSPSEENMDQRLVRLEMSVGQLIESNTPADSMYDPIYDSVYQD